MDEKVKKHPKKSKKRVMRRRPWKKSYYALILAQNPENLFEIIGTRQFFFRRYDYLDMYIVGLAVDYEGAVKLLQQILEDIYRPDASFEPRKYFDKDDFK
jgi:hypothetical protein